MASSTSVPTREESETLDETFNRHRVRIEARLDKLRKAVTRWHNHNAEYEALAEELAVLPNDASREDMLETGKNLGGTVVDTSEVQALLGDKVGIRRTRDQTIEAIKHRISYVAENIAKVEKQIDKGETELSSLYFVQGNDIMTEEGDPVVEITEELDEFDNVISSSTFTPGGGQANTLNVKDLEKFERFVQRLEATGESSRAIHKLDEPRNLVEETSKATKDEEEENEVPMVEIFHPDFVDEEDDDTLLQEIPVHEIRLDDLPENEEPGTMKIECTPMRDYTRTQNIGEIKHSSWLMDKKPSQTLTGQRAGMVAPTSKEEDFVLTVDEPPDEADLRRQMIDYSLHDVGAIVAELTLEEGSDEEDGEDDEEDDDTEDEYGRSTSRFMTEEMCAEMRALQARIKAREEQEKQARAQRVSNKGEKPEQRTLEITVTKEAKQKPAVPGKKGVRFADKLDVAPSPAPMPPTVVQSSSQSYTLSSPLQPDPDDAVPFLVELLARQQMEEDLKAQGFYEAKINGRGEETYGTDEAPRKEKTQSVFKTRRAGISTAQNEVKSEQSEGAEQKPQPLSSSIMERKTDTFSSAIVDRATEVRVASPTATTGVMPGHVSQFKAAKAGQPARAAAVPQKVLTKEPSVGIYENVFAPDGRTEDVMDVKQEEQPRPLLSRVIIERPPASSTLSNSAVSTALPSAPNELDPAIHRQEIAVDYFKSRNRLIQKEGGFLPREGEQIHVPLDEDIGEKKISRFKAARLRGQPQ